jgi:hypothetical protein
MRVTHRLSLFDQRMVGYGAMTRRVWGGAFMAPDAADPSRPGKYLEVVYV